MLAMAEGCVANDLLWDGDQSWTFPNLDVTAQEQDNRGKKSVEIMSKPENEQTKVADKDLHEKAPPPPAAAKGKKRSASGRKSGGKGGKGGGGGDSDHELHIWTERERRKKMRDMFQSLLALLPHLNSKADKSTIVDEAVNYIGQLQQTLETLNRQKYERIHGVPSREAFLAEQVSASSSSVVLAGPNPVLSSGPTTFRTWTSPNVILNLSGRDAQICICGPNKPGLLTAICFVLEKYKLEVISAQVSSDRNRFMFMIHTNANGATDPLFPSVFPVEEIYKQAVAEVMLWVNS